MSIGIVDKQTGNVNTIAGGNSSSVLNLLNSFIDLKASNIITAFNRKWVDVNTTLSTTMPQTGFLLFFIKKARDGYSFYVDRNGKSVWTYDNFAGENDSTPNVNLVLGEATCMIPVMKGDTITVSSNALGTTDDEKYLITNCKILYNNQSVYTIDGDNITTTLFSQKVKELQGTLTLSGRNGNGDALTFTNIVNMGGLLKYVGTGSDGKKYYEGAFRFSFDVSSPISTNKFLDINFNYSNNFFCDVTSVSFDGDPHNIYLRGIKKSQISLEYSESDPLDSTARTIELRFTGTFYV